MPSQGRVILIDHRKAVHIHCRNALETSGFSVTAVETGKQGLGKARQESFDVALLSLEIPDTPGVEVLERLKEESPNTAVIILKRNVDEDTSENLIENGAFDSLSEPFSSDALAGLVLKAARHARRTLEDSCIGQELERLMLSQVLIGRSDAMQRIVRFVRKAATVDSTVLITGEKGTGKEVVARAIHRISRRSNRRFVSVDCRKSLESLHAVELFGHFRGPIPVAVGNTTGKIELAEGGTLFLDEISDIGISIQEKLLQVILERKIPSEGKFADKTADVRIISSTEQDISRIIDEGRFREDLFYRLNSLHISIPPLRERLEDIPLLADYYIRKFASEKQRPAQVLSEEAMRSLKRREWPGNVRELINVLERSVPTCEGATVELRDLPHEAAAPLEPNEKPGGHLARMEREEIFRILERFRGNKTRAAKYLGINRKTLREKMERYGLNNK